jgi:DNA modification methylase
VSHQLIIADVMAGLAQIQEDSVQCVVTSPPYWGLRDYGTAIWKGGQPDCEHTIIVQDGDPKATGRRVTRGDKSKCLKCGAIRIDKQIGLEPTIAEYVERICKVFDEVWRVLKDDGCVWLNLGDTYASGWACPRRNLKGNGSPANRSKRIPRGAGRWNAGGNAHDPNLKEKDLCMVPARVAIGLQDRGWHVRSKVVWEKSNGMTEAVTDRPTGCYEEIFLLSKKPHYYYNPDAIRQPLKPQSIARLSQNLDRQKGSARANGGGKTNGAMKAVAKSKRVDPSMRPSGPRWELRTLEGANCRDVWTIPTAAYTEAHYATFPPEIPRRCILSGSRPGDTVLDPFVGSGTTMEVAIELGRDVIGIELDERNRKLIESRILSSTPPLSEIVFETDRPTRIEIETTPQLEGIA